MMRPTTLRVKIPPLSTMIMFVTLVTVISLPSTGGWRGLLFYAFGAYMLFRLFWNKSSVRWGHLLWLLSFYLLGAASRNWAMYPGTVIVISGYVRFSVILSWAIAEYITQDDYDLDHMCKIMLWMTLLMVCNYLSNVTSQGGRFSLKINSNSFGIIAGYLFGFMLYAAKKAQWKKILPNVMVGVLLVIVLLTGSRKALIMVALFVVAFFLFWTPEKGSVDMLLRIVGIAVLIVVAMVLIMKVDVFYNSIGQRVESLLKYWMTGDESDASAITRTNMINIALDLFLNLNPIFGIGLNNFKYMSGYMTYAHNNYVEILCSLGVVGMLVYYGPMIYFTIRAFILWRKRVPGAILPLSILILQLVNDAGQVSYYSFSIQIFLGIAIGYIYQMQRKLDEQRREEEALALEAELEAELAAAKEQV